MRSRTTVKSRQAFARLPKQVQEAARNSHRQFKKDPQHPGLRFKQVHASIPVYSARVGRGHRAIGRKTQDEVVWFWVGTHAQYDKLLRELGFLRSG